MDRLPTMPGCGTRDGVPDDYRDKIRMLTPAKALAIAAYGESVAAYRYRTLSDKAPTTIYRDAFTEMATEEQGHHADVQKLLDENFPDSDFVLSPDDKDGPTRSRSTAPRNRHDGQEYGKTIE